jgi:hypothetical protein
MPSPATLLLFAAAALALVAIPGPNHLYIVTRSLSQGRRIGLASAFGVETGTLVHICAAAAGISAVIASSAVAFHTLRYVGAAYLAFLGVRALLRDDTTRLDGPAARPPSVRRAYFDGVLVNVFNPKTVLLFLPAAVHRSASRRRSDAGARARRDRLRDRDDERRPLRARRRRPRQLAARPARIRAPAALPDRRDLPRPGRGGDARRGPPPSLRSRTR